MASTKHRYSGVIFAALWLAITGVVPAAESAPAKPAFVADGSSLFMVFANSVAGKESEFNTWYDRHMKAIVGLPGFVRVQRFESMSRGGRPDPVYRFVVVYEMRGNTDALMAEISKAVKEGKVEPPDPALVLKTDGMVYRPITPVF